jgi:hypothetical protein
MAQEGIYKNPVVLNPIAHKSAKVGRLKDFKFAQDMNSVLIAGQEFMEIAKYYPIVFVRDQNIKEIIPLAILGLRQKGNLFVDSDGKWKEGVYLPGFLRRYPFTLADNTGQEDSFAVCVDAGFEGFDQEDGIALFNEDGKPTKELNGIVEFLRKFQTQYIATQEMIRKLDELNLFKEFTADITMPAGEKLGFKGTMMVDEKAILQIEDQEVLGLFRRGFLAWIYAHLYSISNFRALGQLESKKAVVTEEA